MDAQVPLDAAFRDETGKRVLLRDFLGKKPLMLNLIQYRCTMLCSQEMLVLAQSLKEMPFTVGNQFNLITLSIDHRETPELAGEYKRGYLKDYGRSGAERGWHFLTGDEASIQQLADAIGYRFVFDAPTDSFMHPDGVIILTPEGRVSHYFFRLDYPPRDMKWALVQAGNGKIGSPLDAFALLCYHYNPATGKYSLELMGLLRMAALATLLSLGLGVGVMSWRGRRRDAATRRGGEEATGQAAIENLQLKIDNLQSPIAPSPPGPIAGGEG